MVATTVKLKGRPLSIGHPQINELIKFLETLPDDEVLSTSDIVEKNFTTRRMLRHWAKDDVRLAFYRYLVPWGRQTYYVWGNPKAIVAARKQTEKEMGASENNRLIAGQDSKRSARASSR
jgi:hypothetical protein